MINRETVARALDLVYGVRVEGKMPTGLDTAIDILREALMEDKRQLMVNLDEVATVEENKRAHEQ